ncbi:hypothetical protein JXA48_01305 [Candidatus Woesearchaeota archaeon]|nr:hypothetical protein [Candidatus Woesearchaeota archaeon]
MATFLDLALFQHVSSVFVFLFVFLIVYAFLNMSKIFKDVSGHNGIYAIVALTVAFLSSFSSGFVSVVSTMAPWFTVIIVFIFLSFFVARMFTTDEKFFEDLIKQGAIKWVLIITFVIILLVSISNSFGQQVLEQGTGQTSTTVTQNASSSAYGTQSVNTGSSVATNDFGTNMTQTLFNPKILGMLLIILISFFTILLIARTSEPS